MAQKRTKFDRLQRNVERLARRDAACREKSEITDQHPEPADKNTDIRALEEQIRLRAHELFEACSRVHGLALDDWLQAEGEILGSKKTVPGVRRKAAAA